jgi:hypothetical protein
MRPLLSMVPMKRVLKSREKASVRGETPRGKSGSP